MRLVTFSFVVEEAIGEEIDAEQSASVWIGELIHSRWRLIPVRKLPVRSTCTHCTTGSVPITVQASRVVPASAVSVSGGRRFEVEDLDAPGPPHTRVGVDLAQTGHARRPLSAAADVGGHSRDVAARLRLDQGQVFVAFEVLDREETRQDGADRKEHDHPADHQ